MRERGEEELRFLLTLASRRFHGHNSSHECGNSGHGLVKAVITIGNGAEDSEVSGFGC